MYENGTSTLFTGGWILTGDAHKSREEFHLKSLFFFAFWSISFSSHFHTVVANAFKI